MSYIYTPPTETPKRKSRAGKIALITIAVVFSFCVAGTAIALVTGVGDNTPAGPAHLVVTPSTYLAPTTRQVAPVADSTKRTAKAKPAPVQVTDEDTPGLVGDDFPAGTYRVSASVVGRECYWEKTNDSEGNDIVANDLPLGGRPQVKLKKGQWFTSEDCGTWVKLAG